MPALPDRITVQTPGEWGWEDWKCYPTAIVARWLYIYGMRGRNPFRLVDEQGEWARPIHRFPAAAVLRSYVVRDCVNNAHHEDVTRFDDVYVCHDCGAVKPGTRSTLTAVVSDLHRAAISRHEVMELDAGFDGGEWSVPAHLKGAHEDVRRICAWHGYTPWEVDQAIVSRTTMKWSAFGWASEFLGEVIVEEGLGSLWEGE